MNHSKKAVLTFCSTMVVLFCSSQDVVAHTVVQFQQTEGIETYNNLVINHGCEFQDGSRLPVIAQSVVFPTVNPVITTSPKTTISDWSKVLQQGNFYLFQKLDQNKNVFMEQTSKLDKLGGIIGFSSTNGNLDVNSIGRVSFRNAGVNFVPSSCAKRLIVKIAVADICQADGAANLWIPHATTHFPISSAVEGIGDPPTLIINRNFTANPFLPASHCGKGYDMIVTPSNKDIDTHLPLPGYLK